MIRSLLHTAHLVCVEFQIVSVSFIINLTTQRYVKKWGQFICCTPKQEFCPSDADNFWEKEFKVEANLWTASYTTLQCEIGTQRSNVMSVREHYSNGTILQPFCIQIKCNDVGIKIYITFRDHFLNRYILHNISVQFCSKVCIGH
jgi:hypothetical protein